MLSQDIGVDVLSLVQTWIQDLVNANMSHSRISARLMLSPSTIQKIAVHKRYPRNKTIKALGSYYLKIFEAPQLYGPSVESSFLANAEKINATLDETKKLLRWFEGG